MFIFIFILTEWGKYIWVSVCEKVLPGSTRAGLLTLNFRVRQVQRPRPSCPIPRKIQGGESTVESATSGRKREAVRTASVFSGTSVASTTPSKEAANGGS